MPPEPDLCRRLEEETPCKDEFLYISLLDLNDDQLLEHYLWLRDYEGRYKSDVHFNNFRTFSRIGQFPGSVVHRFRVSSTDKNFAMLHKLTWGGDV